MTLKQYEEVAEQFGLFLAIIHPSGNKDEVTVVDSQMAWEIDDYVLVSNKVYYWTRIEEVLSIARALATLKGKKYTPFESRYCIFKEEDYRYDELIEEIESYIK